jgi:hypothetical protein
MSDWKKFAITWMVSILVGFYSVFEGDHLTPEGLYQIDRRNKNRFYRALHVS